MDIPEPNGFKRYVSAFLSLAIEVMRAFPGTAEAVMVTEQVAGAFGIAGIGHAGINNNLNKKILATSSSAVAFITLVIYWIPEAAPLIPYLQNLASLLAAAGFGALAATKANCNNVDEEKM